MQNKSHAVMAQRSEAKDSLDDFPTPPWATRALLEHVLPGSELSELTAWSRPAGSVTWRRFSMNILAKSSLPMFTTTDMALLATISNIRTRSIVVTG